MTAERSPVELVYLAGLGHSGTTLLGMLLGQLDGVFYAGELAASRAFERGDRCGCGLSLAECPTWGAILAAAFPRARDASALALRPADGNLRGLVRQLSRPPSPRLRKSSEAYASLLRAILDVTGSRVVVDSSKWPGYAYFLQHVEGVELTVVHLVRDPRAVAHSRRKRAIRRGRVQQSPLAGALLWDVWNPVIEAVWGRRRYVRLRYDDFAAAPGDALWRVARLVGVDHSSLPFTAPDKVELRPTHSVAGNRNRFETGAVEIQPDDEWRTMADARRLVGTITWPLRDRYGYR